MTMGYRGCSLSILILSVISILVWGSTSVAANPVGGFFWGAIILVPINIPFNGFLLLLLYILFIRVRGGRLHRGIPMGTGRFVELILASVLIISATGALIDVVAFEVDVPWVYFAAATLIGGICSTIAWRYLKLSTREAALTGVAFFSFNLGMWFLAFPWLANFIFDTFLVVSIIMTGLWLASIWIVGNDLHGRFKIDRPPDGIILTDSLEEEASYSRTRWVLDGIDDLRMEARVFAVFLLIVVFVLSFF
jgi:hypothetical protein